MIFHENRLLADDSHEISYLIFFSKIRKDVEMKTLWSAAVVIGALRVLKKAMEQCPESSVFFFRALRSRKNECQCVKSIELEPLLFYFFNSLSTA